MKRLLFVAPGLLTLLVACGDTSIAEKDSARSLAQIELAQTGTCNVSNTGCLVCGAVTCDPGYYAAQYFCGDYTFHGCGTCTRSVVGAKNRTDCYDIPDGISHDPNGGSEPVSGFTACGLNVYPDSLHYVAAYSYVAGCSPTQPEDATRDNRTTYVKYPTGTDNSYSACGLDSCRSIDYVFGYGHSNSCDTANPNSTSTDKNATNCKQVVTSSTNVCGIVTCPSTHYVGKYFNTQSCNQTGSSTERNATGCWIPTSTTTSFYACGSTCPSGYANQGASYHDDCRPSNSSSTTENNRVYCVKI